MRGRGGREAGRDVTRRARQVVMICHAFSFLGILGEKRERLAILTDNEPNKTF